MNLRQCRFISSQSCADEYNRVNSKHIIFCRLAHIGSEHTSYTNLKQKTWLDARGTHHGHPLPSWRYLQQIMELMLFRIPALRGCHLYLLELLHPQLQLMHLIQTRYMPVSATVAGYMNINLQQQHHSKHYPIHPLS